MKHPVAPVTPTPTQSRTFKSFRELKDAQRPQPMESCPVCGYRKPTEITVRNRDGESRVRPLVCKGCSDRYHQYGGEIAARLAKGETGIVALTRHQWVLAQLDLPRFEQELEAARVEKDRLNELVQGKLALHGHLPREVFMPLRDKLQEELLPGETVTARQAYGRWRRLTERLVAARTVKPEVEKMIADEATKNSTPAVAEAIAKPKKGK